VAVDPQAVLDAIYSTLTAQTAEQHQCTILSLLESALRDAAAGPHAAVPAGPLFRIELSHACAASGCGSAHCDLCSENPSRACVQTIAGRNLVETELRAQCGARIDVRLEPTAPQALGAPPIVPPPYRLQVRAERFGGKLGLAGSRVAGR